MKTFNRSGVGRRSVSSRAKTFVGVGLGTALLLAGVTLVGVLPASATTPTLAFTGTPFANETAGTAIPSFTVTGANAADVIDITTSAGSGISGNSATANGSGVATFGSLTLLKAGTYTLTAADITTSGGNAPTTSLTVVAGTPSALGYTPAPTSPATADTALTTFKVSTEDSNGNPTGVGTDVITISSSCTLGGTVSETEVAGVATFSALSINQVGTCQLIATDTTSPDTGYSVATASVTVSGGTPEKVAFSVAPPAAVATTDTVVTAFKVAVEDALGNIDTTGTGSTDGITISSTCLAAPVAVTAVAGVATFSTVEFATTGSCTLTATDTSRVIVDAIATVQVGTPQAAVVVTTTSGYLDAPITLAASGGSGTGAVTFTVSNGTATGCTITDGALSATTGGTCIVTATKAAVAPYATGVSAATTVTISSAPKALRVVGLITNGKKSIVTITGYNFSGRPTLVSNVAGFKALVTHDSGKTLTVTITVTGKSKPGVKVLSLTFSNGKRTSVKYSLH